MKRALQGLGAGACIGLGLALSLVGCRQIVGIEDRERCGGADADLAPCASCVLTSCCDEHLVCRAEASCENLDRCLATCGEDASCRTTRCRAQHPDGFTEAFAALEACRGSLCADACGYAECAGYVFPDIECAQCASSCCAELGACAKDASCLALTYCQMHCDDLDHGCRGDCERVQQGEIEQAYAAGACLEQKCNPECYGKESPVIDESTSCGDALPMDPARPVPGTPSSAGGVIGESGDNDFVLVDLVKGDWVRIFTTANPEDHAPFDPLDPWLDTVVTVHRADATVTAASMDDSYPRGFGTTDSELLWRVPESATYCLRIEDFGSWGLAAPRGDPSFAYELQVEIMDQAIQEEWNLDDEPNDTIVLAQSITGRALTADDYPARALPYLGGATLSWIAGVLEGSQDRDLFEVTPAADGVVALYLSPLGPGRRADAPNLPANGSGSTGGIGKITAYNEAGGLLAEIDYPLHAANLGVEAGREPGLSGLPVTKGEKLWISVARDESSPSQGDNDFYAFKLFTLSSFHPEANDVGNDDPLAAELIPDNSWVRGSLEEGDVDHWTFAAQPAPPMQLLLGCSSESAGSGVRGLRVTYLDGSTEVQSGTEDVVDGVLWADIGAFAWATDQSVPFRSSGPHYIRLENSNAEADGVALSRDYSCSLFAAE